MSDFVVVAFGGNAIAPSGGGRTLEEQRKNVRRMCADLGQLVVDGHRVVVTHGNGPQVGEIMLRSDLTRDAVPPLTFDVGGAMSQGQLGYLLQQEIANYLHRRGRADAVCSLVTQVVVDPGDPAFSRPTKPIGRFYSKGEAHHLSAERGWHMVEDAGRGYRRVVASPAPQSIVEWPVIRTLVERGVVVIAAGGGGIPVIQDASGELGGVEAVIDKDLSAQKLATLVGAGTLALLTEVEHVAIDFGTTKQRPLGTVSVKEMEAYQEDGQFPPGSMGPKIAAVLRFLHEGGQRAIITTPQKLAAAIGDERVGTQVMQSTEVKQGTTWAKAGAR